MPHVLQCAVFVEILDGCFLWIAETEFLGFNGVQYGSMPDRLRMLCAVHQASTVAMTRMTSGIRPMACGNIVCFDCSVIASRMLPCSCVLDNGLNDPRLKSGPTDC